MKRIFSFLLLAGVLFATAPPAVRAELPPLIPRDVLFGNPEKATPQISPDGTHLAYLAPDAKNVLQVWVQTIGKDDAAAITKDSHRGIREYLWAPSGQQVLYFQDNDGDENFHMYASDLATKETRDLTPFQGIRATPVATDPKFPNEMLVQMNRRNKQVFDVYRLDFTTGALTLEVENPGNVGDWTTDLDMKVRGRTLQNPDGTTTFEVRDTPASEWHKLLSWPATEQVNVWTFDQTGKSVYMTSTLGADAARLVSMDVATGKETTIAEDPKYDVAGVMMAPKTNAIQAVAFNRARTEWKILDPSIQADVAAMSKLSDGDYGRVSGTDDDQKWLVGFTRDAGGVKYYVWDRGAKKGDFLFSARPKLDQYTLSPMQTPVIKTRDGLNLQCYLTTPMGMPAKNLPLVLYVHGGPWARDAWGFNGTVQWYANRGYAVLQVNYRGSTGFGKPFLNAATHEFAGKMHNDLIDAVNWAVKKGIADPKKVCITGGSYGGYATLVGLTFTPDVFACGVDVVGPSNLVSLIESFPPYWKPFMASSWYPRVGDPSDPAQRKDLEARSPLFKVSAIKAPLMIIQGANDPRVTKKESDQMVEAMQKQGKEIEYYVFADEGHGLQRPENRLKYSALAERFLAKHLGGRAEPIPTELMMEPAAMAGTK